VYVAIDRMDWHYGGDFPAGLDDVCGGTHIGMFLAWIILHDLVGDEHREDSAEELAAVRERRMTGREFLIRQCDEKFWDADLNHEGLPFTKAYYVGEDTSYGDYLRDYEPLLAQGLPSAYHVQDSWENYDRLAPAIDSAYRHWKAARQ
jgi:hypothetical protein